MIDISAATLSVLEARFPHLKPLCDRYRMLEGLYEQASFEVDDRIRKLGFKYDDPREDSQVSFLNENLMIVEDELASTGRQIQAILRLDLESP